MELPDVGRQCAVQTCRCHDFLPIQCQDCGQYYCKDHALKDKHQCPQGRQTEEGVSTATAHDQTSSSTSSQDVQLSARAQAGLSKAKARSDALVSKKKSATSSKIRAIKLKQKAIGTSTIPPNDRFVVNLRLVSDVASPPTYEDVPMFFGRSWTLRKCLDSASTNLRRRYHAAEGWAIAHSKDDSDIAQSLAAAGSLSLTSKLCKVCHEGDTLLVYRQSQPNPTLS